MKKLLLLLSFILLNGSIAHSQFIRKFNSTTDPSGCGNNYTIYDNIVLHKFFLCSNGVLTQLNIGNTAIRIASQFPGSDMDAKVIAAIADLPATGGIVDARGLDGAQSIASALSIGTATKPVIVLLGVGTITTSATITVNDGSALIGLPQGMDTGSNDTPTIIKQANSVNLASIVSLSGPFAVIQDITIDGNKANNPTALDGLLVNLASRAEIHRVTVHDAKRHGVRVASTGTANQSCCGKIGKLMSLNNGGDGLKVENTNDVSINDKSEFEANAQYGIELSDSSATRIENSDISGNDLDGIYIYGTNTGMQSNKQTILGNHFSNNSNYDIRIVGHDGTAYTAVQNQIVGNMFLGSGFLAANNTYSNIRMTDSGQNTITGNVLVSLGAPNQQKYGVEITETVGGRNIRDTVTGNSFAGTNWGTGSFSGVAATTLFCGNGEANAVTSQCGLGIYHPNDDPLKWKNAAGVIRNILTLDSNDDFIISGDAVRKQGIVRPNGTDPTVQFNDTQTVLFQPLVLAGGVAAQFNGSSGSATITPNATSTILSSSAIFSAKIALSVVHFAARGAVVAGVVFYCDDCDPSAVSGIANECTSAGTKTGAVATGTYLKWACLSVN